MDIIIMNNYDIDYFIQKFEAIPARQWCIYDTTDKFGRHCAIGHCGARQHDAPEPSQDIIPIDTPESAALRSLFKTHLNLDPEDVNDSEKDYGVSPRQRILTALRLIKARAEVALEAYELRELKPITKPEPATA